MMMIFEKFTQRDKLLHFIAGMVICLIAQRFFAEPVPILIVALVGVLKEVYDEIRGGNFSFFDLLYTLVGGGIVHALCL